jgi:DNA-binding response OmpR family regulator
LARILIEAWARYRFINNNRLPDGGVVMREQTRALTVTPYRLLLAEDNREMRGFLARVLRQSGYDVVECPDGMAMLTHLAGFLLPNGIGREKIDLIISEIRLPGVSGMEVLEGRPTRGGFPPMILMTASGDEKTHERAARLGVAAMIDKPFDVNDLLGEVRAILH